jgi:microcystin-dependent protein
VIYAAGDSDTVGQIVGSNTHTLTEAELPSHRHTIPALSGTTSENGAHTHKSDWPQWNTLAIYRPDNAIGFYYNGGYGKTGDTTSNGAHTHTVTTNASTTGSQGVSGAGKNMPPYETYYCWKRTA